MNHVSTKSMLYIDSQNRTSGKSGNFSIYFAMPPNNRYARIVVMQASIPKRFYLVKYPYNTFQLLEPGTSSSGSAINIFGSVSSNGATKTITLTEGNYSKTNMIVCLQTMLSLASSLNSTLATQYVYTVGYPVMQQPNTCEFTYTVTNLTTSQPQFIFSADSTLHIPMGFNRASTNIFLVLFYHLKTS
jgi:hypothetical protein